jgi:iron complex outermembrane recepter protein
MKITFFFISCVYNYFFRLDAMHNTLSISREHLLLVFKGLVMGILCFVLLLNSANANVSDLKVRGVILDSLSESPIENATVQLLFENIIIKTELSKYDGSFSFSNQKKGKFLLTVSHIGYKTQNILINIDEQILPNISIKLQLDQVDLAEITIKATKPLVSQLNGEIIYQIEGSIWQNSGNALNIINRIPILKGRSGSAYLLYGTKVVFLIDSKPAEAIGINLEAVLSNLGTGEIDKIEILTSPPPSLARFGNPIVNIKTIKLKTFGSLINLNHGFARGKSNRFNNGIKYTFKQNNLLLGISLLQSQINQFTKTNSTKVSPTFDLMDSESLKTKTDYYYMKLSGEYSSKKLGEINISFAHKNITLPSFKTNIGQYKFTNNIDNLILNSNANAKSFQNIAGIDLGKKFDNIFNIKTSIEIGQYDIKNEENISLTRMEKVSTFENPWNRNIVFKNYYFENESKIGEMKLTAGIFYKTSESDTKFIKNVGSNTTSSNSFKYLEKIQSTFVTSKFVKGKSDFTLGLNLEHTNVDGLSNTASKNINFFSLLPTLAFNYQINDTKSLSIAYQKGINRPDYEWLNQQELYKNPYNKNIGGGVLQPTIYNKITVSNTFANGFTLTGIYANQVNRYSFYPLVSGNQVNFSAININKFYYLYYSGAYQKYFSKIWYFSADLSGYYSNLKSTDYGIKNAGYTQQFSLSNYFTFKKLGQFGITSSYNTTDYADSYRFLPQFSLNVEYSKSIFRKNGSINISFSDLTNSLKDRFVYKLDNFTVKDTYKYETRLLKLLINYKFGNKNVKSVSPRNSKAETEIGRLK